MGNSNLSHTKKLYFSTFYLAAVYPMSVTDRRTAMLLWGCGTDRKLRGAMVLADDVFSALVLKGCDATTGLVLAMVWISGR